MPAAALVAAQLCGAARDRRRRIAAAPGTATWCYRLVWQNHTQWEGEARVGIGLGNKRIFKLPDHFSEGHASTDGRLLPFRNTVVTGGRLRGVYLHSGRPWANRTAGPAGTLQIGIGEGEYASRWQAWRYEGKYGGRKNSGSNGGGPAGERISRSSRDVDILEMAEYGFINRNRHAEFVRAAGMRRY